MFRNPLGAILTILVVAFVATLGFFYIQEGSFEGAGERMDDVAAEAEVKTKEAADNVGEATEEFIDDVSDGDDDTP